MAPLTPVPGDIELADSDSSVSSVTYGASVSAGDVLYKNSSTGRYHPASNTGSADADASAIALTGGSADSKGVVVTGGSIKLGDALTVGEVYVVGSTAGDIEPIGDLGSGDYVSIVGIAETVNDLKIAFAISGVAKP